MPYLLTFDSTKNKKLLKLSLKVLVYLTVIIGIIVPFFGNLLLEYELGKIFGNISATIFLFTQIPGIIRRFQAAGIIKNLGNLLMFSRRELGIFMFVTASVHYLLMFVLPTFRYGFNPPPGFVVFGILAFYLSLPLFLTSNQWSKKKLKKKWNYLHKLSYLILWAIFLHVSLNGNINMSLLIVAVGVLQLSSFIFPKLVLKKIL